MAFKAVELAEIILGVQREERLRTEPAYSSLVNRTTWGTGGTHSAQACSQIGSRRNSGGGAEEPAFKKTLPR